MGECNEERSPGVHVYTLVLHPASGVEGLLSAGWYLSCELSAAGYTIH